MGQFYSRPNEQVENMDLSFTTYRWPPKSGNYFSTHFIMGDQTFAGTQPECFLFGDNNDLNFLSPRPVAFPYPVAHRSEPSKMLRSLVNLRKDSLRLIKNKGESDDDESETYYVDFVFDADVKCTITVHYLALEDLSTGHAVYTTSESSLSSRVFEFEKGANQSFGNHGKLHLIKPSNFKEVELIYSETTNHIPVIIHIEAMEEEYAGHSNITMANIEKLADDSYAIKLLKQKQMVDGLCYLLHEIYGLESKDEDEQEKTTDMSDDDYDEYADENVVCVVCMSDTRDTLMLPCKHLCVCSDCASNLRSGSNNCPICRVPFHALLQLCAYQRSSTTNKSQDPYPGYEKVDLFDALNAFNIIKRRESTREIVRRVSARARSRSRPTTPKPSQMSSSEKMMRRSSSRFSRGSHGSHRQEHVDGEPGEESISKSSLRSSSRIGSGKSHVVELAESDSHVVYVKNETLVNHVECVEKGIEVGQDNLGMDSVEEEIRREKHDDRSGSTELHEIDETSSEHTSPSPTPSLDSISEPYHPALTPYNVPLPGTPLDKDLADTTGSESEPQCEPSADNTHDETAPAETLII